MGTPARIGKREYTAAIHEARQANQGMRELLKRIMAEGGPVVQALAGRAGLLVLDNEHALARLEEIGRNSSQS